MLGDQDEGQKGVVVELAEQCPTVIGIFERASVVPDLAHVGHCQAIHLHLVTPSPETSLALRTESPSFGDPIAKREVLDAADEAGDQPLRGACELDGFEAGNEFLEQHANLHARE